MKYYLLKVYIEVKAKALNRLFSYVYHGDLIIKQGTRVLVNFNNRKVVAYVYEVEEIDEKTISKFNYKIKFIDRVIDEEPLLNDDLFNLAIKMSEFYFASLIEVLQVMLPPSLLPFLSSLKAPKIAYQSFLSARDNIDLPKMTNKQLEVFNAIKNAKSSPKTQYSPSIVKKLLEFDVIFETQTEKDRFDISNEVLEVVKKENQLTEDQLLVLNKFRQGSKNTFLLQGVTGSGKSEIYLRLAEEYIKQNKGVIIIVSEISLTPLMISLCLERFNDEVAVLHSSLTPAQKYDQYRKIKSGKAKVVVGARSAIFAPVVDLGLIVVDEEHTGTYHQDTVPFYQVQDVAQMRQSDNPGLKVLFASATPSIITKAKAVKGVYEYLELPKRINEKKLPEVEIVNMLDPLNLYGDSLIFSKELHASINEVLKKKEQAILLLNRRGFAAYLECERCHSVVKCPNCEGYLTYHKSDNKLKCHRCELTFDYPSHCLECGYHSFYHVGFGTERVEEELKELFPHARIKRLDGDTKNKNSDTVSVLNAFNKQEIDILVGTQMIAKGHDFENVTLSAVLMADIGLKMPNYMASENAFSLIYQTIGRAGRGKKEGKAIILTFNPQHYAIRFAALQDYESFFRQEMQVRKVSNFPPYYSLALLHIYIKQGPLEEIFLGELQEVIRKNVDDQTIVVGPYSPYIKKYGPFNKHLILLRTKKIEQLRLPLTEIIKANKSNKDIKLELEINPLSIF